MGHASLKRHCGTIHTKGDATSWRCRQPDAPHRWQYFLSTSPNVDGVEDPWMHFFKQVIREADSVKVGAAERTLA